MAIFVVIGQPGSNSEKLPLAIEEYFPEDFLQIQDKTWLVAWKGTAHDFSQKIGVTDGTNGSAIICSIGTYFGRANPDIWAWIKEKWETVGG